MLFAIYNFRKENKENKKKKGWGAMAFIWEENNVLKFKRRQEIMEIYAYGSGLRVRATENVQFTGRDWALTNDSKQKAEIKVEDKKATISNGKITAVVTEFGRITFLDTNGEVLLKEYYRGSEYGSEADNDLNTIIQLRTAGRMYHNVGGDNYRISVKFESDDNEKLYGMGQYQHPYLNLKGCHLEMMPKNTQASVPFLLSSKGYGLLWNNPGIGTCDLAMNRTEFNMESCKEIDYWITAGDTPAEIVEAYADVSGKVPMMPDYGLGFWQCKLRYASQDEVLNIAREYKKRNLPLNVIVIDFFHWVHEGDWGFDPKYWPDPKAMCKELHEMGIKVMVSIWPTVEDNSVNYQELYENGLLVRANSGQSYAMSTQHFFDATNPEAQKFVWKTCRKNYLDMGIDLFWLDEAEPEYSIPDFDAYRMYEGSSLETGNRFSVGYAKAFYDGMKETGNENPVNLIRSAWAGSQKYGALVWSGDVPSTYTYMDYQMKAGLNMGLAGIPWWTADIGGFHGGNINDPEFRELLIRWFQFGTFCPVMRLHGNREPHVVSVKSAGGQEIASGADNEIWSYGQEAEKILTKYVLLRENMKPYTKEIMKQAHEKGSPVMRTLFYEFPEDAKAWEVDDAYLFGADVLVAPIVHGGQRERKVYLPQGASWVDALRGTKYEGGQEVVVEAPLEWMPVFTREGSMAEGLLCEI